MCQGEKYAIGIDIGGTKIATGIVGGNGELLEYNKQSTYAQEGPTILMERIEERINLLTKIALSKGINLSGIGVSIPGVVEMDMGRMLHVTQNLPGWTGISIREYTENKFNLPTWIENDGNAAAWGEKMFGSGKEKSNLLMITVGTGIGGGLIYDSKIIRGFSGAAGSFGHIIICFDGPVCNCGNKGCIEAYASGPAIVTRARKKLNSDKYQKSAIADFKKEITAKIIVEAALKGDELASSIIKETGQYIGFAAISACNLFNPEMIIIGGGVSNHAGELLISPIREIIHKRALPLTRKVDVVRAKLGEKAGLIGAASLALDYVGQKRDEII